jgi:hypothetical protein
VPQIYCLPCRRSRIRISSAASRIRLYRASNSLWTARFTTAPWKGFRADYPLAPQITRPLDTGHGRLPVGATTSKMLRRVVSEATRIYLREAHTPENGPPLTDAGGGEQLAPQPTRTRRPPRRQTTHPGGAIPLLRRRAFAAAPKKRKIRSLHPAIARRPPIASASESRRRISVSRPQIGRSESLPVAAGDAGLCPTRELCVSRYVRLAGRLRLPAVGRAERVRRSLSRRRRADSVWVTRPARAGAVGSASLVAPWTDDLVERPGALEGRHGA